MAEIKDGGSALWSAGGLRFDSKSGTGGWTDVDEVGGRMWTGGSFGGPSLGLRSIPVDNNISQYKFSVM